MALSRGMVNERLMRRRRRTRAKMQESRDFTAQPASGGVERGSPQKGILTEMGRI
jgi:hypothetical protein